MAGEFILMNLENDVNHYINQIKPRGWQHGHTNKMDWSHVECKISSRPEYHLSGDAASAGSFTARSQKMTNKTSTAQQFELSESVVTSNKCQVDVHGGVQPGAAPVQLQLPTELNGRGLPTTIALTGGDGAGTEEVKWKVSSTVTVPKKSTVIAKVSGSELRRKGTFAQKTNLVGFVVVRHINERGVSYGHSEISIDDLVRETHTTGTSMRDIKFLNGGIEYVLRGTCNFHITVDSTVEVIDA